ncbi:hypothetical protein ABZX99_32065 [Streptomyces antibioticus]|uniref:hypothetical protein n=1 Tax=Streptomyces antibioticus TaxID=1890 RepID=UPI0033A80122
MAYSTVHDGNPPRPLAQRPTPASPTRDHPNARHQALTAIAPWWNPPWDLAWQRAYQQAKSHHHTGQDHSLTLQRWTKQQRTRWNTLHPTQQHLLTTIGIHPR